MKSILDTAKKVQAWAAYAKKAVIGFSTAALAVVAAVHPAWSPEAGVILGGVIAVLGAIAQFKVTNAKSVKVPR